jgi:type IV pilus assembly protein PilV
MKPKLTNEGFTLLEILVAIAILCFGLLAIATMQVSAIKGNTHAIGLTEAVACAQDKIEELMPLDYNDADLVDTDSDGTGQDADDDGVDDDGGNFGLDKTVDGGGTVIADSNEDKNYNGKTYSLYWNVAVDEPVANVKIVRVIVEWSERGKQRSATLDFMKADII